MKTPGVYIVEKNAFPNSVVEVETAVPAFIGYTQKAFSRGQDLTNRPLQISSLNEFHELFGFGPEHVFKVSIKKSLAVLNKRSRAAEVTYGDKTYQFTHANEGYLLYSSLRMFFNNGGGKCFVVSVGSYEDKISHDTLNAGLALLVKEQVPTIVVVPDAMRLDAQLAKEVHSQTLMHCADMKNRIAILDIPQGDEDDPEVITSFRTSVGKDNLSYGTAYYPWLQTSLFTERQFGLEHIDKSNGLFTDLLQEEFCDTGLDVSDGTMDQIASFNYTESIELFKFKRSDKKEDAVKRDDIARLNEFLHTSSWVYRIIMKKLADKMNLLPPSGAIAGVYTLVDSQRGVWMAPANVSLNCVDRPAVSISHDEQKDLSIDTDGGKSINAIREFIGEGVVVWGARTLDGNSLDWRYINVRRTMIMLGESVKLAAKAYVFEPNTENTWITMKSMISNFLTGIWKRGGLAGAVPADAFSVHVGLGETMTPEEILEGILRITVLVAPSRPAEFIEITFQQQQQRS